MFWTTEKKAVKRTRSNASILTCLWLYKKAIDAFWKLDRSKYVFTIDKARNMKLWRTELTISKIYWKRMYKWLLMLECSKLQPNDPDTLETINLRYTKTIQPPNNQNKVKRQIRWSWVMKTPFFDHQLVQCFQNTFFRRYHLIMSEANDIY